MELFLSEALLLTGLCHISFSRMRRKEKPQLHFGNLAVLFSGGIALYSPAFRPAALPAVFYSVASIGVLGLSIPLFFRYATSLFVRFPSKHRWIQIADVFSFLAVGLGLLFRNGAEGLQVVFLAGSLITFTVLIFSLIFFFKRALVPGRYAYLAGPIPVLFALLFIYLRDPVSFPAYTRSVAMGGVGIFSVVNSIFLFKRFSDHVVSSEKNRLRQKQSSMKYRRFFPRSFLNHLGRDDIHEVSLGDHVLKRMSVMFVDIRNFTSLSERLSPLENFRFINGYFGRMGPVIRSRGGFIDKYIGDGILALFPGPNSDEALKAAVEIQGLVRIYNSHRHNSGYSPIRVGIGIHAGDLMLGIVGERERLQGTVISDAVNLASRLEGLNKTYGSSIIISNEVLISLDSIEDYNFRILDRVRVRGKEREVSVIEILDGEADEQKGKKKETRDLFEQGLIHFHLLEYDLAAECFRNVLTQNPHDVAAELYVERCLYYTGLMALTDQAN